jgi:hypothetical protein
MLSSNWPTPAATVVGQYGINIASCLAAHAFGVDIEIAEPVTKEIRWS